MGQNFSFELLSFQSQIIRFDEDYEDGINNKRMQELKQDHVEHMLKWQFDHVSELVSAQCRDSLLREKPLDSCVIGRGF